MAETVNCQSGKPNRLANSAETIAASAVGNMAVIPLPACSRIAATVASGEWPVIEPVSPKQKSIYELPSTSVKRAPFA